MILSLLLACMMARATPPNLPAKAVPRTLDQIMSEITPTVKAPKPAPPQSCADKQHEGCAELEKFPHAKVSELPGLGGAGNTICGPDMATEDADACRRGSTTASANRYATNFVATSSSQRLSQGFVDVTSRARPAAPPKPSRPSGDPIGDLIDQNTPRTNPTEAIAKLNKQFSDLRTATAERCCGTDSKCKIAYSNVPVRFCKPSKKDPCTTGARFRRDTFSDGLWAQLGARARALKPSAQATSVAALDRVIEATPETSDTSVAEPVSGYVEIPPYVYGTDFETDSSTLRHELSHACNFIHRQLDLLSTKDPDVFAGDWTSMFPEVQNQDCVLSTQRASFRSLYETSIFPSYRMTPAQQASAFACMMSMAATSVSGNTRRAKCENACPAEMAEEALADFLVVDWSKSREAVQYLCRNERDSLHGFSGDFAECLAQNSAVMRLRLRAGLQCGR